METSLAVELRWLLLGIGVLLIAGVYLHGKRRGSQRRKLANQQPEHEPGTAPKESGSMHRQADLQDAETEVFDKQKEPVEKPFKQDEAPGQEEKIVVLHVRPRDNDAFDGSAVLRLAENESLVRGGGDTKGYFESRSADNGEQVSWFFVANMFHPGTFNWATLDTDQVKGLSFIARFTAASPVIPKFEKLHTCARRFANALGGDLLDDKHCRITLQMQRHIEDELSEFQLRCEQKARGGS